jgi:hypothetical protein
MATGVSLLTSCTGSVPRLRNGATTETMSGFRDDDAHCRKEATPDSRIQRQRSVVLLTYISTRTNIAGRRETEMRVRTVRTLW